MARNFINANTEEIQFGSALGTLLNASPLNNTFLAKYRTDSVTFASDRTILAVGSTTSTQSFHCLLKAMTDGQIRTFVQSDSGAENILSFSTTLITANKWHTVGQRKAGNTVEVILDGVLIDPQTPPTFGTWSASDTWDIGALASNSTTRVGHGEGDIAEVAVWEVNLTQAEIESYHNGMSPLLIRPGKLIFYSPLWGTTQENDLSGKGNGTGVLINTPAIASHPPVNPYTLRRSFISSLSPLFPYVPPVDPVVNFNLETAYTPPVVPNVDFNLIFVTEGTKLQISELQSDYEILVPKLHVNGELRSDYEVFVPKLHESELSNKYSVVRAFLRLSELNSRYSVEVVRLKLSELSNKYDVNPAILALAELQNKYAIEVAKLRQSEVQSKYSVQDQKLEAQLLALYAFRFGKQFEAKFGVTVARQFLSQAFYSLSTQLAAEYSINTTAKKQLDSLYDITNTDFIEAQFDSVYAIARITTQFGAPYSIGPVIKRQLDAPYILATVPVAKQFDSIFDITNTNPVVKQFKGVFAILTTQIINITGQPTVTLNGEVLDIATADVSIDEGSFIWRATIGISDIEDYVKFAINDDIVLDLYGETFNLVVESKRLSRSGPAEVNMSLVAVSPAIKFDFPRATALEISFTSPILAEAAAEQVLNGEDIDWQITDWLIPANRLAIKDGAPIRLVQDIVEAAGGVLESKPDGQLVARPLFPVSLPDFPTASLDQTYTDSSDNLSVSEQFSPTKRLNKFRVLDVSSRNRDNMEFEFDDIIDVNGDTTKSKTEGVLRIFPSPFRTNLILRSSRGGEVGFQLIGIATEQREQQVEFKEGFSSLSEAIESIDSVVWEGISLGAISFAQGDTKISSASVVNLYGLATIKYTTKFLKYKVSGIESIDVQFRTEVT